MASHWVQQWLYMELALTQRCGCAEVERGSWVWACENLRALVLLKGGVCERVVPGVGPAVLRRWGPVGAESCREPWAAAYRAGQSCRDFSVGFVRSKRKTEDRAKGRGN